MIGQETGVVMKRLQLLVLFAGVALGAGTAHAQVNPFKGGGPRPQAADLALMDKAAEGLIQDVGFLPDEKHSWANSATGWASTVTAVKRAKRRSLTCRVLDYTFTYTGQLGEGARQPTWCQTKDGTWRIG